MGVVTRLECDECKSQSNGSIENWWSLLDDSSCLILKKYEVNPLISGRIVCGMECVLKAVSKWMSK
jgi:hypothetical protein